MIITTRIKSHILEKVIGTLMAVFGISALFIFFRTFNQAGVDNTQVAIIEILLIVVLAILAQTIVLIRIYEQNLDK